MNEDGGMELDLTSTCPNLSLLEHDGESLLRRAIKILSTETSISIRVCFDQPTFIVENLPMFELLNGGLERAAEMLTLVAALRNHDVHYKNKASSFRRTTINQRRKAKRLLLYFCSWKLGRESPMFSMQLVVSGAGPRNKAKLRQPISKPIVKNSHSSINAQLKRRA